MKKVAVVAVLAMSQTGVAARKFWTFKPADPGNVLMTAYTIGNGRQGGLFVQLEDRDDGWPLMFLWLTQRLH
jgi:alpha-L-fucosidase 2